MIFGLVQVWLLERYLPPHTAATAIQHVYRSYLRNKPYRLQVEESAFSFEACLDEAPSPDVNIPGTMAAIMADFALIVERRDAAFALLLEKQKTDFALLLGKHFSFQICGHWLLGSLSVSASVKSTCWMRRETCFLTKFASLGLLFLVTFGWLFDGALSFSCTVRLVSFRVSPSISHFVFSASRLRHESWGGVGSST